MITSKHHVPVFVWFGLCAWGGYYSEYLGAGLFVAGLLLLQILGKKE